MTARDVLALHGQVMPEDVPAAEELAVFLRKCITPEEIEELEARMLDLPQTEVPVEHIFCEGVYIKQITLPRNNFAIGHAHKEDCINVVLSGSASVLIDGQVKRITGPCTFIGKAFDRKVGYIHEDCTWQTIHATRETDLEKLEELLIIKSGAFKAHERRLADRLDFTRVVSQLGYSEDEVRGISENLADQIRFPFGEDARVEVRPSKIEGLGLFARRGFAAGQFIASARVGNKRTPGGRYTNHAVDPNAEMVTAQQGVIDLVALRSIAADEEITVNYRQARQRAIEADRQTAI